MPSRRRQQISLPFFPSFLCQPFFGQNGSCPRRNPRKLSKFDVAYTSQQRRNQSSGFATGQLAWPERCLELTPHRHDRRVLSMNVESQEALVKKHRSGRASRPVAWSVLNRSAVCSQNSEMLPRKDLRTVIPTKPRGLRGSSTLVIQEVSRAAINLRI